MKENMTMRSEQSKPDNNIGYHGSIATETDLQNAKAGRR